MIRDLKKYNPQQVSLTRPRSEGGENEAATRTTLAGLPPPRILRFCSALDGDLSKSAAVEDVLVSAHLDVYSGSFFFLFFLLRENAKLAGWHPSVLSVSVL